MIFQEFGTDDRLTDNNNLDDVYIRNKRERERDSDLREEERKSGCRCCCGGGGGD